MYRYGEWKENKAHWKQQHRTSLLAHQSIVMLLSFSCAQQVHLGKATSTTAKNLLFLSALDITSIIALQFAQREKKKKSSCVLTKELSKNSPVTAQLQLILAVFQNSEFTFVPNK